MSENTSLLQDISEDAPKRRLKLLAVIAGAIIGIIGIVTVIVTLSKYRVKLRINLMLKVFN